MEPKAVFLSFGCQQGGIEFLDQRCLEFLIFGQGGELQADIQVESSE